MESVKKSIDERALHKREYDTRVNERQMHITEGKVDTCKALDTSLVDTESSGTKSKEKDTSSKSGNDSHADDADIRLIYDEEPMAEVQTTAEINIFATRQQHTEQPEFNNKGEVDQNAEQCHDTCPLPAKLINNQTTELSNLSLEYENIHLKKTVAQLQKDFLRMEAHCVNLELKYQNQALKEGQHGQFSKVKSNEAKVKHDIDVIETINIELEHKVAKLLMENETLKRHYKEMFDSIKTKRAKNIEHTTSLIANNDNSKAQLQEKGFAIAALKNELRKLTGNNSERPRSSRPRFSYQVDVNNNLSKPVTTYYLPKEKESAVAKPHHMIAPGSSRYSSNDMVHNHYLEEANQKTQESSRNLEPSMMPSARSISTANGSKPKPRNNTQTYRNWPASKNSFVTTKTVPIAEHSRNSRNFTDSKHFVCSTCQKCVFNANHDNCVTKFLNEVNSRAKIVGLIWVPTGKIFAYSINKVDSEPANGSDEDITNQYEYEQTLDVSVGTLNLSASTSFNPKKEGLRNSEFMTTSMNRPVQSWFQKVVLAADKTTISRQELELLFHHHITMLRSYKDRDVISSLPTWSRIHYHILCSYNKEQTISIEILKNHETSRIKEKDFAQNSDIQIFLQGESNQAREIVIKHQDDAKYSIVVKTQSQGGQRRSRQENDQISQITYIRRRLKSNVKSSRFKITKHKGTKAYIRRQR
ncbi:hypothetical protein Tco_0888504 [Tanacetum coccineum]